MLKHTSFMLAVVFIFFNGCSSYNDVDYTPTFVETIYDDKSWYSDMKNEVSVIRVHVPVPNSSSCKPHYNSEYGITRPCTLDDVYNDTDSTDNYEPRINVRMYTDEFSYNDFLSNASFKQKGKSTRKADLKSYRIKLDSKDVLRNGERTFQLNKHPYDDTSMKNKMAFDLIKDIPNILTLKTEFINLIIDDVDYGLFTHVEAVGEEYLRNRGFNIEDYTYKAQDFAFFDNYAGLAIDDGGKPLDEDAFDSIIEPKSGDNNHAMLIEMINAVNDETQNFNLVFNKYFNRENYITWMAINIILANKDTVSQNFYLYNPRYSSKFYFIPWDYDGAGREDNRYAKWNFGLGNWWGIPLHNRFLREAQNRLDLDNMVKHLSTYYITPERVQDLIDLYTPAMSPYILGPIDDMDLDKWNAFVNGAIRYEGKEDEYYQEGLIDRLKTNIQHYKDELGSPMPFWQFYSNGAMGWEESVDLEGDAIIYDVQLADNNRFENPIVDAKNIIGTSYPIILPPGLYYMRVTAREIYNPTHYQVGFDRIPTAEAYENDKFGILKFIVQ